jgi:hypothetical protein
MIYKNTLLIVSEVVRFHLFSKECAYIENSKIWIYCTHPENVEVINVVCQVPLMSQIMIVRMFVHSVLVNMKLVVYDYFMVIPLSCHKNKNFHEIKI